MNGARIAPLPVDEWPEGLVDHASAIVAGAFRPTANVYCTLANSPSLFEAWLHLGGHLLRRSALSARDREMVILRSTALAQAPYPFTQHVRIGQEAGLTAQEIDAILDGPSTTGLSSADRLVLTTVDELMGNNTISDNTWEQLQGRFTLAQTLDLIATVAFYRLAGWVLNTCKTPLDSGQESLLRVTHVDVAHDWSRAATVRVAPLPEIEWPAELLAETSRWPRFVLRPESRCAGVYTTLANHADLFRSLGPLIAHFFKGSSLDDRHRELIIIRSCYRDRGEYPYRQHVSIARLAGLNESSIAAAGAVNPELVDPAESALIDLIDQLHDTNMVSDECWRDIREHFTTQQVLDAVALAGFYGLISFVLSSAGTKLEPDGVTLPDALRAKG